MQSDQAKIVWFHGESDEVSGSPRIPVDLQADGEIVSRKTRRHGDAPMPDAGSEILVGGCRVRPY